MQPTKPKPATGNYRNYLNKEYLAGEDLEPGKEYPFTISRMMEEQVFDPGTCQLEAVLVAYFKEMEERHAKDPTQINKRAIVTAAWNMRVLTEMSGSPKVESWAGLEIALYRGNEGSKNKKQYGVRFKRRTATQEKA